MRQLLRRPLSSWTDQLTQDLNYGLRTLAKSPAYSIGAVLILTLGLGLNLTFFTMLNATTFQPLALKDPATLVRFLHRAQGKNGNMTSSTVLRPTAEYIRDHSTILSAALFESRADVSWGDDAPERVHGSFVSPNWFEESGSSAALGRVFRAKEDGAATAPPAVVLSFRFWRTRLGGDSGVVGTTMQINNRPVVVIGVASPSFVGMRQQITDMWLPISQDRYFNSPVSDVDFYARIRPGLSPAAIREATRTAMAAAYEQGLASMDGSWLEPLSGTSRFESPNDTRQRWTIAALVGSLTLLVLLIACTNLSNLMFSRAITRKRELSMRTALGASRGHVISQLLTECLLLAVLGSVGGSAVAYLTAKWIVYVAGLQDSLSVAPDWRTISVAAGLALFTMLAVGLLPAWKVSRQDLALSMKDGGQNASHGLGRSRLRQLLLGVQVAGSCLLLILAGMAVQSVRTVLANGPGFDFRRFAVMDVSLSTNQIQNAEAPEFWALVKRELRLHPQTEGVTLAARAPFGEGSDMSRFRAAPGLTITNERVEADFFEVMRVPILAGRSFAPEDTLSPGIKSIIVSRNLAAALYGDAANAIGKPTPTRETIIGVAGDTNLARIIDPNAAQMYRPLRPEDLARAQLLVRARSDATQLLGPIRSAARAANSRVIAGAHLMESDYEAKLTTPRLTGNIVGFMALLSFVLACLGVFSLVSQSAALRNKEIGIRTALGADWKSIIVLLLRQLTWPTALGLFLGGAGAAGLSRLLAGEPFNLTAFNPVVLASALAILAATAAVAGTLPAVRALRHDPLGALRSE